MPKRKKKDVNAAESPLPATESVQKPTAAKSKAKTKAKCKRCASAPASKPKVIKKPKSKARGKRECAQSSKPGASKKKETNDNKQKKIKEKKDKSTVPTEDEAPSQATELYPPPAGVTRKRRKPVAEGVQAIGLPADESLVTPRRKRSEQHQDQPGQPAHHDQPGATPVASPAAPSGTGDSQGTQWLFGCNKMNPKSSQSYVYNSNWFDEHCNYAHISTAWQS